MKMHMQLVLYLLAFFANTALLASSSASSSSVSSGKGKEEQQEEKVCEYEIQRAKIIEADACCPISLEEADDSFVLVRTGKESGILAFDPIMLDQYINTFVESGRKPIHPVSRREFLPAEIQRVRIYRQYKEQHGSLKMEHSQVLDMFKKYIEVGHFDLDHIPIELSRWVDFRVLDEYFSGINIDRFESDPIIREQFCKLGAKALEDKPLGSWILRPSSLKDNDHLKIFVRALSYNGLGPKGLLQVKHQRIIRIMGVGYASINSKPINDDLDLFHNDQISSFFPSLMHYLVALHMAKDYPFDLSRPQVIKQNEQLKRKRQD